MANHPWYGLAIWRNHLRPVQLSKQPLCERCLRDHGRVTEATVVHHLKPHKGDWELFTDPDNLASSCKRCHDSTEQSIERRGYDIRIGDDGWPVDPNHPFNKS